jgi:hypothetical protein
MKLLLVEKVEFFLCMGISPGPSSQLSVNDVRHFYFREQNVVLLHSYEFGRPTPDVSHKCPVLWREVNVELLCT